MRKAFTLAVVGAAASLTTWANAQSGPTGPAPQYFTGRLGYLFPIDSNLKDVASGFWGLGVDFTFGKGFFSQNSESFVSID